MKEKLARLRAFPRARQRLSDILGTLVFFCVLVGLDAGLRLMFQDAGITPVFSSIPWVFTLAWALMLSFAVRLLPPAAQRVATAILGALASILFLVNALMLRAKGNFFSFSSLIFAGDGFKFLDASYLRVRRLVWVIFVCGVLGTALAVWLIPSLKRGWRDRLVSAVMVPICILAVNANRELRLTDRLEAHFDIYQASLLYDDFTVPNQCLMLSGLYQYTFRDFCLTYGVYDALNRVSSVDTLAQLDDWYASKTPDPDNRWTGRFKGKNLMLIQLEAIDTWMAEIPFMPNLCRIRQESLDFTQTYTPLYLDAGTFNTEMIVNTGLVSPFTGSTSSMYSRNAYPDSLARLFRAEGYSARSFHRSGGEVYNRSEVHENWGYEKYYSHWEMGLEELDFDSELMRAYDMMVSDQPFFSFIITYSGHGPYDGSSVSERWYDFAASQLPEDTDEMLIHAFAHAYETDLFIGLLFDRLEADGLLENTVLVFYSDHYDYYTLNDRLVMEQKGVTDKNLLTRTPFFIYEKNTPGQTVEKVASAIDILPTLVNLFGLDNDGTHYVGNDIFSENGGYAIFADYSWYDGSTYWNSLGDEAPTDEVAARNQEISRRLKASWDTMRTNYFASR